MVIRASGSTRTTVDAEDSLRAIFGSRHGMLRRRPHAGTSAACSARRGPSATPHAAQAKLTGSSHIRPALTRRRSPSSLRRPGAARVRRLTYVPGCTRASWRTQPVLIASRSQVPKQRSRRASPLLHLTTRSQVSVPSTTGGASAGASIRSTTRLGPSKLNHRLRVTPTRLGRTASST